MACTIEKFRNGMVNNFKRYTLTVGWFNDTSPIVDVTATVKSALNVPANNIALLIIRGDDLSKIRAVGRYPSRPTTYPDGRSASDANAVVYNWVRGEEWERQFCEEDKKYYWVVYPCHLVVGEPEEVQKKIDELSKGKLLWYGASFAAGALAGYAFARSRTRWR